MNETTSPNRAWYWGAVVALTIVGAGALYSKDQRSVAFLNDPAQSADSEPGVEDLARDFRRLRNEISGLTEAQQREVWQSLHDRTESLAEQTFYAFFALPEAEQVRLIDLTIERLDWRRRLWQQRSWARRNDAEYHWPVREVSTESTWDRPFAELTLEERLALRRDYWDDTTTQANAMRSEFYRLVSQRRKDHSSTVFYRSAG